MLSSMWVRNPTGFSPDASLPDLSNKTFFVTGATAGIGYETALALAKKSATVVIGARSEARARDAIASIKAQVPEANVEFIQMDLADLKTVADAARTFRTRHDKLDCLVNNAGRMRAPHLPADLIVARPTVRRNYGGTVRDHEGRHRVAVPDKPCGAFPADERVVAGAGTC